MFPADLKYTAEHEWTRVTGDIARIGITDFAQAQLGDVVYVDITKRAGEQVSHGESFGVVESVKAASDLFCPVTGTVVAVNARLAASPELVNQQPYGEGWMVEVRLANLTEVDALLSAEAYEAALPAE